MADRLLGLIEHYQKVYQLRNKQGGMVAAVQALRRILTNLLPENSEHVSQPGKWMKMQPISSKADENTAASHEWGKAASSHPDDHLIATKTNGKEMNMPWTCR